MIHNYRTTNRNTEEECTQVVIVSPEKHTWSLHRSVVKLGQKLAQVTAHWTQLEMKLHSLSNEYAEIGLQGLKGTKEALTAPQCCQMFGERRLKPQPAARGHSSTSTTQPIEGSPRSHIERREFRAVEVEMDRDGVILRNKFATYNDVVRVGPWKNDVSHTEDAHNVSLDSSPPPPLSYRRGQRRHPHMGITGLLYWSQKHQRRLSDGDVDKAIPRLGVSSLPSRAGCQVIPHRNGVVSSPGRLSTSLPKAAQFGSNDSVDDDETEDEDVEAADADDEEEYEKFKAKHRHLFELPRTSSMPANKQVRRPRVAMTTRSISVVAPNTPPTSPHKKSRSLPGKRGRRPSRADTIARYEDCVYDVTKSRSAKDNTLKWFISSMRRLVSRQ